jgi:beta-lactamase regulating signal transducer with metallopeptidase domain
MTETLQLFAQTASTALISSLWQGVALAAVIWLCLKLAPRTSAAVRFAIWSVAFAAIAVLPFASLALSHIGAVSSMGSSQMNARAIQLDSRWALGIAGVWAAFALVRLLTLASNAFRIARLWNHATPVATTPELAKIFGDAGLRKAKLCASDAVDQPCVIGFFAPRILVPGWLLEKASPAELEQIVMHELAHLRRFDDWTNLAQKLAVACFPLNPALAWIERHLAAERELACDESVVASAYSVREYATCLTNLAAQRLERRKLTLANGLSLGAWERRSQLATRIECLLRGSAKLSPARTRLLAIALVGLTLTGAVRLGSSAPIVAFASASPRVALEHTEPSAARAPHYQDVVFHPKAASSLQMKPLGLANVDQVSALGQQTAGTLKTSQSHPAAKRVVHRAPAPANDVRSVFIVTRWHSSANGQLTVVDQVVRISALSAAQAQAGWFVVQL